MALKDQITGRSGRKILEGANFAVYTVDRYRHPCRRQLVCQPITITVGT